MAGKSSLPLHFQKLSPGLVLQELIQAYQDYVHTVETEKTKRAEIAAWRDATVAEIQARRDVLIGYLNRSFDERATVFSKLLDTLDAAIAAGDNSRLALTLAAIVDLAKSNPFHNLADLKEVQAALADPDHVWEL
ncbi:MAG: hypothetical protein ACUVSQ_04890 [Pseudanabaenaceae cyanobacterium]